MQKTSLVLSGGGALGAAHIGAVRAIQTKFEIDYIMGTSAGAIMAAALACGKTPDEISTYLKDKKLLSLAFDFSFKGSGIIRGKKILGMLEKIYEEKTFEDLNLDLRICATNFNTGKLAIIKSGSISKAVRASLAVPGIFEPMWIDGEPLIDGGLVSNFPIYPTTLEYKGDSILAIDACTALSEKYKENAFKLFSIKNTIERTLKIIFLNQKDYQVEDKRLKIIKPALEKYHGFDILKLKKIERIGYEDTLKALT